MENTSIVATWEGCQCFLSLDDHFNMLILHWRALTLHDWQGLICSHAGPGCYSYHIRSISLIFSLKLKEWMSNWTSVVFVKLRSHELLRKMVRGFTAGIKKVRCKALRTQIIDYDTALTPKIKRRFSISAAKFKIQ